MEKPEDEILHKDHPTKNSYNQIKHNREKLEHGREIQRQLTMGWVIIRCTFVVAMASSPAAKLSIRSAFQNPRNLNDSELEIQMRARKG